MVEMVVVALVTSQRRHSVEYTPQSNTAPRARAKIHGALALGMMFGWGVYSTEG